MEADLVRALQQLEGHADAVMEAAQWTPPVGAGTVPAELEERARKLLASQAEVAGMLAVAKRQTAQHLDAVSRIPEPDRLRESIYLDITG